MNKKIIIISVLISFIFLLFTGCDSPFVSAENLIHPPKMSGTEGLLQECFLNSVKDKGKIVLKSPLGGEYRSAFTLFDIDSDKNTEAIVFYSVADDDLIVYMNILKYYNGNWVSTADITGDGTDIAMLDFADFNNDGNFEIITGYSFPESKSNKNLSVYSLKNESYNLNISKAYTDCGIIDIDNDGFDEIAVAYLNSTAETYTSEVSFLKFDENMNFTEFTKTDLYSENSGFLSLNYDCVGGVNYLFIDEMVGNSSVTEIVYYDVKTAELVKPVNFDITNFSKCPTSRNIIVSCKDIDSNGHIDIPKSVQLNNSKSVSAVNDTQQPVNIITWNNYDGKNFKQIKRYVENTVDGYIIQFDDKIIFNLNILFDNDEHIAYFRSADTDELLFKIKSVLNVSDEQNGKGVFIKSGSVYSLYCELNEIAEEYGITYKTISDALIISDEYR